MQNKLVSALGMIVLWLSSTSLTAHAQQIAYPGVTGVLRTPSAKIAPEGVFSYQFNTLSDISNRFENTNNHVFIIGLGQYFEAGGRLTDWYNERARRDDGTRPGRRDLSGNFKFRIPRLPDSAPQLAIGVLDFAGEAVNFESRYLVASKGFGKADFSLGYASGETEQALDGFFASAQYRVTPQLALQADYASDDPGLGAQISHDFGRVLLSATASAHRETNDWDRTLGLNIAVPLDYKRVARKVTRPTQLTAGSRDVEAFFSALRARGINRFSLGTDGETDVIEFENQVYNHSALDGMAVVLSTAYQHLGVDSNVRLIVNKSGVGMLALQTSLEDYGKFRHNEITASVYRNRISAGVPAADRGRGIKWVEHISRAPRELVDIRLQPALRSIVGSEFGVFDYSLALRADIKVPLPKNTHALVTASLPIANSDLFDNGNAFEGSRFRAQIDHAVVQKYLRPQSALSLLLSGGYSSVLDNDYGLLQGEAVYDLAQVTGQIEGKLQYLASSDSDIDDQQIGWLGYRHFWRQADISLAFSSGQFFAEERGSKIELARFFGDAKVTAFINYADTDDISGGLRIGLPLTPNRDRVINGRAVVRGSQHWQYAVATTIKDPIARGTNRVRPNMLLDPLLSHELDKDILDNNRLTVDYLNSHLERLKLQAR